ncbi:DUF1837 domain-containing protein [uncultured Desulfobacter sp.]|uniref:HamA C-terminal domain-containing protein n=1 Tax=uncultured Desulfobacter sp. TaxID=240139 RepID=UPI002AA88A30|nr:DUF1837 domain-containing protein [uncultured Desulfobacter sp.]
MDKVIKAESFLEFDEFAKKLVEKIRDQQILLKNLFKTIVLANSENRSIHLHVLKSDNNSRPQVGLLVRELSKTILDYCIPRKQIIQAVNHFKATQSTQRIVALKNEAQKLFTDISNSGEGGELLLFVLTESVLGYPQVLSKMALKTSAKMHYHGLDGVYISCSGNPGNLRLHFGESKIHKNPIGSVREAICSIATMLKDEGFIESARRDYYLLNSHADLANQDLEEALKKFLDPLDENFLAPEICAVLLSGHEVKKYPVVMDKDEFPIELIKKAKKLVKELEIQTKDKGINNFHIDQFLIPFPDVQVFRDLLLKELGLTS